MDDFTVKQILDRRSIVELASRFSVTEFQKEQSSIVPVDLAVRLKNGNTFDIRVTDPKGSKKNPLTQAELEIKFSDCLDHSIKIFSDINRTHMLNVINSVLLLDDMNKLISQL